MTGSFVFLLLSVQPQCSSLKRKANLRRQHACVTERFTHRKQRAFFKGAPAALRHARLPTAVRKRHFPFVTQRLADSPREGRGTNRHALGCIITPRPKNGRGWYIAGSAASISLSDCIGAKLFRAIRRWI